MKTLGVKTLYSAMYEFKNDKGLDDIAFTPWLSTKLKIVDYVGEKSGSIKAMYVRRGGNMFEIGPGYKEIPIA